MKFKMKAAVLLASLFFMSSCAPGRIVRPDGIYNPFWSEEELDSDFVMRNLEHSEHSSAHLIRLKISEKPHIHETHDLTVTILKGKGKIHFPGRTIKVKKGDVIFIPHGIAHYAENCSRGASEVYAIFTPPYDGQDNHPVSDL